MYQGKYLKPKAAAPVKAKHRSALLVLICVMMVVTVSIGGTIAWLADKTDPVVNTFTTSDIGVKLEETTTTTYKMIPGYEIAKDPKASVTAGSEAAWLFVKVEKSAYFDRYMTYEIAEGWTLVDGTSNVYARKVVTDDIGTAYSVLEGDKVTVLTTVTKEMMKQAENNQPTLTVTAYASQLMKNNNAEFTAVEAWANVNP